MLKPGDPAPTFDLPCAIDGRVAQSSLAKVSSELVLISFYPRDVSLICPPEVTGLNRAINDLIAEQTFVLGASVDDVDSHLRWATELGGISFPLLADDGGSLAQSYGVFDEKENAALRATFILDRKRTVVFSSSCPFNVGRSVSETLRIARALRTGQLCPADWTPGADTGAIHRKF